jgi:hypothetical protein
MMNVITERVQPFIGALAGTAPSGALLLLQMTTSDRHISCF